MVKFYLRGTFSFYHKTVMSGQMMLIKCIKCIVKNVNIIIIMIITIWWLCFVCFLLLGGSFVVFQVWDDGENILSSKSKLNCYVKCLHPTADLFLCRGVIKSSFIQIC